MAAFALACGSGAGASSTPTAAPPATLQATATTASSPTMAAPSATVSAPPTAAATATPASREGDPSPTAVRPTATVPPAPTQPAPPAGTTITVVAKGLRWQPNTLTAAAGGTVTVIVDNQDAGVPHDIVIFDPGGARLVQTDAVAGPVQQQVSFSAAAPGRYAFKCTVHPLQMTGSIAVQ